jgi:hypothetical protein
MVYFVGAQRLHTLSTLVYTIDAGSINYNARNP